MILSALKAIRSVLSAFIKTSIEILAESILKVGECFA